MMDALNIVPLAPKLTVNSSDRTWHLGSKTKPLQVHTAPTLCLDGAKSEYHKRRMSKPVSPLIATPSHVWSAFVL